MRLNSIGALWLGWLTVGCGQSAGASSAQGSGSSSADSTPSDSRPSAEPNTATMPWPSTSAASNATPVDSTAHGDSHSGGYSNPAATSTHNAPSTVEPTGASSHDPASSSSATETTTSVTTTAPVTTSILGSDSETSPAPDCQLSRYEGVPPRPLTLSGNTFAHDPTMLVVDDTILRFWTGDFVPSALSTNLFTWSNAKTVYGQKYPAWVEDWKGDNPGTTFNFPWAPDAVYFGGQYHLYASFSAFFGRNSSCITHLTSDNPLTGSWTDHGPIICSQQSDAFNAIDADVGLTADGEPWLSFGSFWDGIFGFPLAMDGSRAAGEPVHLAWAPEIEAPVLFYHCGYYYLLVSWGLCCPGEGRRIQDLTYRVVVGRSNEITGPYVDRDGVAMTDGGGTLLVEGDGTSYAAAGHGDVLSWNGRLYHVYHAYKQSDGAPELRIIELLFDDEGWPVGGTP